MRALYGVGCMFIWVMVLEAVFGKSVSEMSDGAYLLHMVIAFAGGCAGGVKK